MAGWDLPLSDAQRDALLQTTLAGFQEDKDMIEAVQAMMVRDPRGLNYPEVVVTSDVAGVQARRLLKKILVRDITESSPSGNAS